MQLRILLAIAAGSVSAMLFFGLFLGAPGGVAITVLTAVPLFAVGLGIGAPAAVAASFSGVVTVALVIAVATPGGNGALPAIVTFAALHAVPAAVLSRQALLSRPVAQGEEWYPVGMLTAWLVGLVAGYFALTLLYFALFGPGLLAVVESLISAMVQALSDANPELFKGQTALPPEDIAAIAPFVPGMFAASAMVFVVISGALAQALLTQIKRNIRPRGGFIELELPMPLLYAFGAALALSLTSGNLGMVGKTLAAILAVAYVLQGLAVLHAWARRWKGAHLVLTLFYLAFFLVWLTPVLVVGLGLVEQVAHLRRRGAGGGRGSGAEDE